MQHSEERQKRTLTQLGRYSGHGLTLGLSTALFAWLGSLADERLQTGPLFVLLGTFVGFSAGFYAMYRALVIEPRRNASDAESGDESGDD